MSRFKGSRHCGGAVLVLRTGMMWYYVSDLQERLAGPEDQLSSLAASGVLRPTTLVWHKGMVEWVSAGEVKPEWFQAGPGAAVMEAGNAGLVAELARTLRTYAGWVSLSGWLHGGTAVACVALGTVLGYFAWLRPERLAAWSRRAPESLRPLLDHSWWTVGALVPLALLLFFMGAQLIGGAARVRRAEHLQSRDDLRVALRSMGSFFRSTVLSLGLGLLLLAAGVLHHYRPWQKKELVPPPAAPVKERVSI